MLFGAVWGFLGDGESLGEAGGLEPHGKNIQMKYQPEGNKKKGIE